MILSLMDEMSKVDFDFALNRTRIVEASLINLWFFLHKVASYSGPYAQLTDHLHVDMCNIRQDMLSPGYRGAVFIPRSMYKSTIFTHGAGAWEIIRDPNIRIGIASAKTELSQQFMIAIQRVFDSNDLIRHLFPSYCPSLNDSGEVSKKETWSRTETICPARSRDMPEPTIKCIGVGGNTQGNHFDLLLSDDLVGEAQLDSGHLASAEMLKIGNWFDSNSETLLIAPKESRVILSATRYAIDDAYSFIFDDLAELLGYWEDLPYKAKLATEESPAGQWHVYYRQAVEYDECIFPEKIDKTFLQRMKERNPWSYYTQYLNNPFSASVSEFKDYELKRCELDYTDAQGYFITYFRAGEWINIPLAKCEVTIGVDPAASEKRVSNKTSRSAMILQARDWEDRYYYLDLSVGYLSPTTFVDNILGMYRLYADYVESTNVEMAGPFKLLKGFIEAEQVRQKTYIGLRKMGALPDKDAKIRNFIQPILERGALYVTDKVRPSLEEELRMFPGGTRKDLLDAMELAARGSVKPDNADELRDLSRIRTNDRSQCSPVTGY